MSIAKQTVLLGIDSIAPATNILHPVNVIRLSNGIFYYANAVREYRSGYPQSIPVDWASNTIMDCTFNTLNAGNIEYAADNIDKILVKRRRVDAPYTETNWTTLFEIPTNNEQSNLNFVVNDFSNVYGATYIYQLVPVSITIENNIIIENEGIGQDSKPVESLFDGVFICDSESLIRLIAGVEYSTMQTAQLTGVHQTLGGKYPIIVANSDVNYHSSSISGTILNENYGKKIYELDSQNNQIWNGKYYELDRKEIVEARKKVDKILTNKKPKIIKDDNGNAWLVFITDDISCDFFNDWGRGLGNMSAGWTEIGDVNSGADLKRVNIFGEVST